MQKQKNGGKVLMHSKSTRVIILFAVFIMIILNAKNIFRHFYPAKYSAYIIEYSKKYNLDPFFVSAVIKVESNFNEKAKSSKNAYGLMQITEDTGKWAASKMKMTDFKVDMLYDPETNIKIGCWYLNNLSSEFKGDIELILAAYNGGRGNVQKWLKSSEHSADGKSLQYIPFKETDQYIKKVKVNYNIYKFLYKIKNNR